MKTNFPDNVASNAGEQFKKGEFVTVIGTSQRRGHLLVESKNGKSANIKLILINKILYLGTIMNVPFQYLELMKSHDSINNNKTILNNNVKG